MKNILLFLLLSGLFSTNNAQTLHALLAIDTENINTEFAEIGKQDYQNMAEELKKMADGAGYQLKIHEVIGENFVPEKLEAVIENLHPQKNDVLFFYYSGTAACEEGGIATEMNRILKMGKESHLPISTEILYPKMKAKTARLNIFMVDGCALSRQSKIAGTTRGSAEHKVYSSLLSVCGTIYIASSKCGQYSYGDKNGSYFTNTFIDSIDHFINISTQDLSWQTLLERAKASTAKKAMGIVRVQTVVFDGKELREDCGN